MRFLFVCAGTAGHINPALAVAFEIKKLLPESEFLFVGADRDMEKRLIPREGFELKNIRVTGLARGISGKDIKKNWEAAKNLLNAGKEARKILEDFRPDCVFGTGGYVCYPVVKEAAKKGITTVLHESNAEPGLANKLLSGRVTRVLVSYPDTERRYRKPERVIFTGAPVKGDFEPMTRAEAKERLCIPVDRPLAVSFWGSLGASDMNERMADFIASNERAGSFHHIHATGGGEAGLEKMKKRLADRGITELRHTDLRQYIHNMGTVMTAADLVISRSGGSTLAEITNTGTASILVPSPNVTANQQEKNAAELQKRGAAVMIKEAGLTGESLYNEAAALIADGERLESLRAEAKKLGSPHAREKITEIVLELTSK